MNTIREVEKAGRQFWLAGLGACLVSKEFAVKKLDELFEGTNTLVNTVMSKGQSLEGELKSKLKGSLHQDEKIQELREKLGLNHESKDDKLTRLSAKVDALTDIVAALSVQKASSSDVVEKTTAEPAQKEVGATSPAKVDEQVDSAEPVTPESTASETATSVQAVKSAPAASTARKPRAANAGRKPATRRAPARKTPQSPQSKTEQE